MRPCVLTFLLASTGLSADEPAADCSCLWQGSFTEVAERADLIVVGEVTRTRGNAADFAVEQVLKGPDWHEEIRIWLKARNYCRPDIADFPTASRWLLALTKIDSLPDDAFDPSTPNLSFGRQGDWQLSNCGGYYLKVTGNTVRGNLIPGTPRWDHEPDMNPVLVDLVANFIAGDVDIATLKRASEEDPQLRELMLNTRSFLRGQDGLVPDESDSPGIDP